MAGEARCTRLLSSHAEPDPKEVGLPGTNIWDGGLASGAGQVPQSGRRIPRHYGQGEAHVVLFSPLPKM